jgi:uncharacterized membrane protein YdjX (TVP38/TMEM64 family)
MVMSRWQRFRKIAFIVFLVLIIGSFFVYEIARDNTNLEQVRQYLREFGIWAPVVFIAIYTLGTIFIPSTPFMAVAGILFGFKYGLIYTIIGGFVSSLIVFTVARVLGKHWAESILEHRYMRKLDQYNKNLESGAMFDLILLRIAPIMPFNVLNILMGVSRIKTRDYILGTLIGLIPSNLVAVYFGDILSKIF